MNEEVMRETPPAALAMSGIYHGFRQGERQIDVLCGVDLSVAVQEMVALVGPSGAGKSTLLHLAGLLEQVQQGQMLINGLAVQTAGDARRTQIRRSHIGFVYQFHNLLPEFTALENVMLPLRIAGQTKEAAQQRATFLLTQLGLQERLRHLPNELSGGEQQRVAIGRALANRPALLLADEPTGSLDPRTGEKVFALLVDIVRTEGASILIATHNPTLAAQLDRTLTLHEGRIR